MASNLIYLLTDGDNYKIGIATDSTDKRLSQLNTGNPRTIREVFSKIVGTNASVLEGMLHSVFDSKRLTGEWFCLSESDRSLCVSLINQFSKIKGEVVSVTTDEDRFREFMKMFNVFQPDEDGLYNKALEYKQVKKFFKEAISNKEYDWEKFKIWIDHRCIDLKVENPLTYGYFYGWEIK